MGVGPARWMKTAGNAEQEGMAESERTGVNCPSTPEANWATKSPEVIHFLWARATKATKATNATSGQSWATRASKKSWKLLNFMQITMTRFSGKTLTANRNVDALRLWIPGNTGRPFWIVRHERPKRTEIFAAKLYERGVDVQLDLTPASSIFCVTFLNKSLFLVFWRRQP